MSTFSLFRRWPRVFGGRKDVPIRINGLEMRFAVLDGDSGDQIRGNFETEVYDYIDRLPRGSVFYDLGASIGHFSMYAAARGMVTYAFEPDPKNFAALAANSKVNAFANLHLFQVAIADGETEQGVLLSNSRKRRTGDHHKVLKLSESAAHPTILTHLDAEQPVTTWSLDAAIDREHLPVPNYLKVDIDGSELAFLRGARATLQNTNLRGFMIELCKRLP
jgi:FkbM family methyltransferase